MHRTNLEIKARCADLGAGDGNVFRANGSTIAKPGFMQVYLEGTDDAKPGDGDEKMLPPLTEAWLPRAIF